VWQALKQLEGIKAAWRSKYSGSLREKAFERPSGLDGRKLKRHGEAGTREGLRNRQSMRLWKQVSK